MTRRAARLLTLGALGAVVVLACKEDLTAPGACPAFCPSVPIGLVDTVLTSVVLRDSAFGRPAGYVTPESSAVLIAASLPGLDSRPIIRFGPIPTRQRVGQGTDTTTGAVLQPDSVFLRIVLLTRDTSAHNLTFDFYQLPVTIDSATTLADLAGPFGSAPVRSLNVDSLLAITQALDTIAGIDTTFSHHDRVTGDRAVEDSAFGAFRRFTLWVRFDSTQIPFVFADSGQVALGVGVRGDNPTDASFSSLRGGAPAALFWFSKADSMGVPVFRQRQVAPTAFDKFVSDASPAPLDSNLTVGGLPATRSILRFDLPRGIRDSTQVVRATLILVPSAAAQGSPRDSFRLFANQVAADLGAKSPLSGVAPDSTTVRVGEADTVRIEVTKVVRLWQSDSTVPRALVLRQLGILGVPRREGAMFSEIRFYSTRAAPYRPALHVTYVPRYPFGTP